MEKLTLRIAKLWQSINGFRQNAPYKFWLLAVPGVLGSLGIAGLGLLVASVYFGAFGELPTRETLAGIETPEASWLLDRNGEFLSRYYKENREVAELEELPPALIEALIATEDARFFEHSGIDWQATARAIVYSVILGQREQGGGSTLSQQLAKTHFPREYGRGGIVIAKIREAITAKRFEDLYTKEELLALYLNSVAFGEGIKGVKVASQRFFNAEIEDLKVEQAAVLVGMLKATSGYNPVRHPERALDRRNLVIRRMATEGFLRNSARDSLMQLPLKLDERRERAMAQTSYFSERIKEDILSIVDSINAANPKYSLDLYRSGLRVYTTIDRETQAMAEKALQHTLGELQPKFHDHWKGRSPEKFKDQLTQEIKRSHRYRTLISNGLTPATAMASFGESRDIIYDRHSALGQGTRNGTWRDSVRYELLRLRAGFIVASADSDEILAYVGGGDFTAVPYNSARAKRQVGSTFKPIVYAAAVENGVEPCDYIPNELRTYTDYKDWTPENADGEYGGEYSVIGGLTNSVNTVAVQLVFSAGVDKVRELAAQFGLSGVPSEPSIALGTPSLTLEEMMNVYGTFARRGLRPRYRMIDRIETRDGKLLYEKRAAQSDHRVLSRRTAEVMDFALRQVPLRGTGVGLHTRFGVQSEVAGKTGTTQRQADGWFMGYTKDLVVGAWMGGAYPTIRWRSLSAGQGARTALPIVGKFLRSYEQKNGISSLISIPEDVMLDTECEDFLPNVIDSIDAPLKPDFEAIFRSIFERRQKAEQQRPPIGTERPTYGRPNRSSTEEIKRRNRERAEVRRRQEAERKRRQRERKKAERKSRRKKALEKLFSKPG